MIMNLPCTVGKRTTAVGRLAFIWSTAHAHRLPHQDLAQYACSCWTPYMAGSSIETLSATDTLQPGPLTACCWSWLPATPRAANSLGDAMFCEDKRRPSPLTLQLHDVFIRASHGGISPRRIGNRVLVALASLIYPFAGCALTDFKGIEKHNRIHVLDKQPKARTYLFEQRDNKGWLEMVVPSYGLFS